MSARRTKYQKGERAKTVGVSSLPPCLEHDEPGMVRLSIRGPLTGREVFCDFLVEDLSEFERALALAKKRATTSSETCPDEEAIH